MANTEDLREAYGELSSALNALAGCIMFAPPPLKVADGPGLAEKAQRAAFEFEQKFGAFLNETEKDEDEPNVGGSRWWLAHGRDGG